MTTYKEDKKVLSLLTRYENSTGEETYKTLEEIIRKVIACKSNVSERTYNRMYSSKSNNNLVLKNLAIKCAPEEWLCKKLMHENETDFIGVMLERVKEENIKFDADMLLNAENWEIRFYSVKFASIDAIYKRLSIEKEQVVIHELLKRL